jgi:hypothetical protein
MVKRRIVGGCGTASFAIMIFIQGFAALSAVGCSE